MKSRTSVRIISGVLMLTPVLGFSAARLDNRNAEAVPPGTRNLTLVPGPTLLSPPRQQSAGLQPDLRFGETPVLEVPRRRESTPPRTVAPFDHKLGSPPRSLAPQGTVTRSGVALSEPAGTLTFHPESRWTMVEEDSELKEARENFEAAKARLDKLLAERAAEARRRKAPETQPR